MNDKYANKLLKKAKSDYDKLASLFQEKRSIITPDLIYLKKYIASNDRILDLGCGFGRLNDILGKHKIEYVGTDISSKQVALAKKTYSDKKFLKCDFLRQPFPDNHFDKIFCLSVIHHIPSNNLRIKFLQEIKRLLKPSGKLILTAWYVWDNPKIKKKIMQLNNKKTKNKLDENDIFLPFKNNQEKIIANRYIHCFKASELANSVKKAGLKILETKILKRDKKGENKNILIVSQNC